MIVICFGVRVRPPHCLLLVRAFSKHASLGFVFVSVLPDITAEENLFKQRSLLIIPLLHRVWASVYCAGTTAASDFTSFTCKEKSERGASLTHSFLTTEMHANSLLTYLDRLQIFPTKIICAYMNENITSLKKLYIQLLNRNIIHRFYCLLGCILCQCLTVHYVPSLIILI